MANLATFTSENFKSEVLENKLPVVVDFSATWCQPCRAITRALGEIAKDYAGKIVVGKIDIDDQPGLATRYKVDSVPTLALFVDGRLKSRLIGANPKREIISWMSNVLPRRKARVSIELSTSLEVELREEDYQALLKKTDIDVDEVSLDWESIFNAFTGTISLE